MVINPSPTLSHKDRIFVFFNNHRYTTMKYLYLAVTLLFVTTIAGCSDNSTTAPNNNQNNNNQNTSGDYYPLTKGTFWTYTLYSSSGSRTSTQTVGNDTTVNGRKYTVVNSSLGEVYLIRHTGTEYYQILNGSETKLFDDQMGASWSFDISTPLSDNHYTFTNVEEGLTQTVQGKTYTNVMRVHAVLITTIPSYPPITYEFDYYWAKGIGRIKSDLGVQGMEYLIDYSVK